MDATADGIFLISRTSLGFVEVNAAACSVLGYTREELFAMGPKVKLKIDIAFVRDITTNRDDAAIALTIIRMAHSLRLQVVAEGVETAAQLAYLRRHRCDEIQGYFYSKPLPAVEIARLLIARKPLATIQFERAMEELRNPVRTLLLVDDESDILSSLKRLLRPLAYDIVTATSGEQGPADPGGATC